MSEAFNEHVAEQATTEKEHVPFRIACAEKEEWDGTASTKFMTTVDFCLMIKEAFSSAFYDFETCYIEIPQNSLIKPTISLYFNHRDPQPGETRIAGVSRNVGGIKEGVSLTRNALRTYTHNVSNGDRYYLTEEAQEAIREYLVDSKNLHKNKDFTKDINWGMVVTDVTNRNFNGNLYGNQLTKVSFIDPAKFIAELYKDEDKFAYGISIAAGLAPDPRKPRLRNYMLSILRVDIDQMNKIGMTFGLGYAGNDMDVLGV